MTTSRFLFCVALYCFTLGFISKTISRVLAQRDQMIQLEVKKIALKLMELELSLPPGAAPGTPG